MVSDTDEHLSSHQKTVTFSITQSLDDSQADDLNKRQGEKEAEKSSSALSRRKKQVE